MPIEKKAAKEIISDLWMGLRSIPDQRVVIDLAIAALASRSRSEGHARRVAASILETCQFWPSVAEITQACEYTPDDAVYVRTRAACPHCQGNAFISVDGPYGLSYAIPCAHDGRHEEGDRGMTLSASQSERYRREYAAGEARRAKREEAHDAQLARSGLAVRQDESPGHVVGKPTGEQN